MKKFRTHAFAACWLCVGFAFLTSAFLSFGAHAQQPQTIRVRAQQIILKSRIFPSPGTETILADSTFQIGIYLDTQGASINSLELNLKFPPDKLAIVKPSSDKSLIGVWLEPPVFSNTNGTARLVGIVPGGIVTENGLVATITFKALASGEAKLEIAPTSRVLANDGYGTEILTSFGTGVYTIAPRPPGGVKVFSETSPFENQWYNNNSPIVRWEKEPRVSDFSFSLDNEPATIPDNVPETTSTIVGFEGLGDGLSYFHIKGRKEGVWGGTTHFLFRIDTAPPASFRPRVEVFRSGASARAMAFFFTTDALSGIDHYEIGIIDESRPATESPIFVHAETPFQLPQLISENFLMIVRAIDKAGNVHDEQISVHTPPYAPPSLISLAQDNSTAVFLLVISILILSLILHYIFGHRIIAHARHVLHLLKIIEKKEHELGPEHEHAGEDSGSLPESGSESEPPRAS